MSEIKSHLEQVREIKTSATDSIKLARIFGNVKSVFFLKRIERAAEELEEAIVQYTKVSSK